MSSVGQDDQAGEATAVDEKTEVTVYEKIGVSVPIDGDYSGYVKVEFGHSRVSPTSSDKDVEKTTRKVQAFNDEQLTKRVKKLRKAMKGKK